MKIWIVSDWENETEAVFDSYIDAYGYCIEVISNMKTTDNVLRASYLADLVNSCLTNKDLFGVEDILEVEAQEY